jgi:ParB-like chromosome segregation protein Spo0J
LSSQDPEELVLNQSFKSTKGLKLCTVHRLFAETRTDLPAIRRFMSSIDAPQRTARPQQRKSLLKLARQSPRTDDPSHLPRDEIKEAPSLFQPRFDSIAYAPGRSEGHVARLARVARSGTELDPVKVVAFAREWYLVDGHHRLEAYKEAEWSGPIPVEVRHSELTGDARISWAIQESVEDNKKNRLAMSDVDKMDAAWGCVVRDDDMSIRETAIACEVSERSVATMRNAAKVLKDADVNLERVISWQQAKLELRYLDNDAEDARGDFDFEEKKRREAAKRLKGAMQMKLRPRLLAEVLESYSPGIVDEMAYALKIVREQDGGEDL